MSGLSGNGIRVDELEILHSDLVLDDGPNPHGSEADDIPFAVASLIAQSPDLTGLTQTQQVGAALANRHFGKNFNQAFTSGNFTTTSSTFVTMQTIGSTAITPGNYVLMFHGRFLKTLIAGQIGVQLEVNGSPVIDEEEIALDDDDFFFGHTMLTYVPNLSGNITVTAQMRKIGGGGNIQVESRSLMYWRVS